MDNLHLDFANIIELSYIVKALVTLDKDIGLLPPQVFYSNLTDEELNQYLKRAKYYNSISQNKWSPSLIKQVAYQKSLVN
jgi:hypothetical protein